MSDERLLDRITCDPEILSGKPVISGTRLSVEYIRNLLAHGSTSEEILEEYNQLSPDGILACLLFASRSLSSVSFLPLHTKSA